MSQSVKTLREFGAIRAFQVEVNSVSGTGALGDLATGTAPVVLAETTGASTATLGNASSYGIVKTIVLHTDAGDLILSPSTLIGGTTITFANAGESATLVYTSAGWAVTSLNGAIVA